MPSIISTMCMVAITALALSSLALGTVLDPDSPTAHGLTIFYKVNPSEAQIKAFSTGEFDNNLIPTSPYECGPDPNYPFNPPSFSCANPNLNTNATTPQQIYDYGNPRPDCLSVGVAFEHLQWATWTHACWTKPRPALDTPEGHAEVSFQSTALAFRFLVLYQHDKHILTLNNAIATLRFTADTELFTMREALAAHLAEIDTFYDEEIAKLPAHGGDHRNRWIKFNEEREEKKKTLNEDADRAIRAREQMFWKDSWVHREKTVQIDHLVGEYFERWMTRQTQGGWDWAGMGEPDPAFPVNFRVD